MIAVLLCSLFCNVRCFVMIAVLLFAVLLFSILFFAVLWFRCFVISLFCKFAVLLFVVLYPIRSKGRGSGGIRIEFWLSLFCFNKLHTARIWRGNFLPRCTYFAVSIFLHFHAWIADCFYADVRNIYSLEYFWKIISFANSFF